MSSFFRKQIVYKVSNLLRKRLHVDVPLQDASSSVKVNRKKCYQPELILPWKVVHSACSHLDVNICPNEFVRLLRNQGLPTAEGIIDVKLSESPLSIIFTIDKHIFSKIVLLDICTNEENMSKSSCLFEKAVNGTVIVLTKFPLLGQPFNMTDFRTAIHFNFVANINKFAGHNVIKVAHLNDWGILAAAFLTEWKNLTNRKEVLKCSSYFLSVMKSSLLRYRSDLKFKEEADFCFQQMESGNEKLISDWQDMKTEVLKFYILQYKKIGVEFDYFHFDSCYTKEIRSTFDNLVKSDIVPKEEEAQIYLEEDTKENKTINYFDPTLYELSKSVFAVHQLKKVQGFDELFLVTSSQKQYHNLLIQILRRMNDTWSQKVNIVNLKTIPDFESIRKTDMAQILNKATQGILNKLHKNLQLENSKATEEMAELLGLSSLYINDMKYRRNKAYKFLWEDVVNFGKDTAISFQFCYAGLKGIQEDSKYPFKYDMDTSPLLEPEAHQLVTHLARFDEMVFKSYSFCEPCILYQYLCSLWYFVDKCSNVLKLDIKENRLSVIQSRLLLLSASLKVLKNGLNILGIKTMEKTCASKSVMEEKC